MHISSNIVLWKWEKRGVVYFYVLRSISKLRIKKNLSIACSILATQGYLRYNKEWGLQKIKGHILELKTLPKLLAYSMLNSLSSIKI